MVKNIKGVTLVELLVVIVIIGILMSVAVPSYRQYTQRANRAEAKSMVLQAAASQERFYLTNATYANGVAALTDAPPNGLGLLDESPSGNYTMTIQGNAVTHTITVTAQNGQSADTDCDVFGMDERGRRYGGPGPVMDDASNDPDCW